MVNVMYSIIDIRERKVFVCRAIRDMLVNPNFLKTVGFISVEGRDDEDGHLIRKPCATVFFVNFTSL